MCGIVGILTGHRTTDDQLSGCRAAVDSLRHRGPDDVTVHAFESVILGHARLSIVDPSPRANQPLADATGRWWIVMNGEIYNFVELRAELEGLGHSFRTSSDTEVVLEAFKEWGSDCQHRLNGMWALAIFNRDRSRLFLSRDRLGIKPLYWARSGQDLVFASEMKALFLLGVPAEPDWARAVGPPRRLQPDESDGGTVFRHIRSLQPGHEMTIERGSEPRPEPWWTVPDHSIDVAPRYEDRVEQLRELIESAIRLRLRNDVESGVALSGGVDSSSVYGAATSTLRRAGIRHASGPATVRHVAIFSVSNPGTPIDEFPWIDRCVRHWNDAGRLTVVAPSPDHFPELMDEMIRHQEAPVWSPSVFALHALYRKVGASGVRVLLEGHGGDELFGGYPSLIRAAIRNYRSLGRHELAGEATLCLADATGRGGGAANTPRWRRWARRIASLAASAPGIGSSEPANRRFFRPEVLAASTCGAADRVPTDLQDALRAALTRNILPGFLRVFDRATMAHGVESTPPLLDHRVVEFAFSLPDEDKIGRDTKRILRDAALSWIPESVARRKGKMPFAVPVSDWFRSPAVRSYVCDVLHSDAALQSDVIDGAAAVRCLDRAMQDGFTAADVARLWPALNTHLWHERFCGTPARQPAASPVPPARLRSN